MNRSGRRSERRSTPERSDVPGRRRPSLSGIRSRTDGLRSRALPGALRLVLALWVGVVGALPASAQEEASVSQRRLEYQAAVQEHAAALAAREVTLDRFEAALEQVQQAREEGGNAEDEAQARFLTVSDELQQLEVRVAELQERVEEASGRLLGALDRRREDLESELADATTEVERGQVATLLRDVQAEARGLELRIGAPDPRGALYSQLVWTPRDGPVELETKAEILERKVEEVDTALASIGRRIQRVESELRLERMADDFSAGIDRFDDNRLPVGPGRTRSDGEPPVPADSSAVTRTVPLDQQIQTLRDTQEQLLLYREEMLQRAAAFRERLRRITE